MRAAPRVSPEELRRRIDDGEEIVVLDVRRGSWNRSDVKIRGAVRMDLREALSSDARLPRGVPVVAYCT